MTQNTQNKLEKILSSVKNAGKKTIDFCKDNYKVLGATAIIGVGGYGTERADGGELRITNGSHNVTGTTTYVKHIEEATEIYDNGKDSIYFNNSNPLQIYSRDPNCLPTTDKVSTNAKGINSTTTINEELFSNGFSGTADNFLRLTMYDSSNFEWKNIFLGDSNNSENPIVDIKFKIYNSGKTNGMEKPYEDIPLPEVQGTTTGVYDQRKIMFFNHADLTRDKEVTLPDFAILAKEIGKNNTTDPERFGVYVGSNVNDLGAYSDIDRNGEVGLEDIAIFSEEWLWKANDPNTW